VLEQSSHRAIEPAADTICCRRPNLHLERNLNSWANVANLLFIDQPVGTGLSFATVSGEYVHNEQQMASDMYNSLLEFYRLFPAFANRDLYLGASY